MRVLRLSATGHQRQNSKKYGEKIKESSFHIFISLFLFYISILTDAWKEAPVIENSGRNKGTAKYPQNNNAIPDKPGKDIFNVGMNWLNCVITDLSHKKLPGVSSPKRQFLRNMEMRKAYSNIQKADARKAKSWQEQKKTSIFDSIGTPCSIVSFFLTALLHMNYQKAGLVLYGLWEFFQANNHYL